MTDLPILWGLGVSPWTEKARWALDHHRVAYRYREHVPMLGEPALRFRARSRPKGTPATVPLLIDGSKVITESDDIARYAEQRGKGEPLFPPEHIDAIAGWLAGFSECMRAARVLITVALLADPRAQEEMLPPQIPAPLRGPLRGIGRAGSVFFARKYGAKAEQVSDAQATVTRFAERLRKHLNGREHLLGDRLTYADIAAAQAVNGFAGGIPNRLERAPAVRETWTRPELVERFSDLVEWRDRLYTAHRPPSARVR